MGEAEAECVWEAGMQPCELLALSHFETVDSGSEEHAPKTVEERAFGEFAGA